MFTRSGYTKNPITNTQRTPNNNKTSSSSSSSSAPSAASTKVNKGNKNIMGKGDKIDKSDNHVESLDELLQRMQRMFDTTNAKIETSVENCKRDLQTEISTLRADVHNIKTECSSEIRSLSDSMKKIGNDVRNNRQRIMVGERINDLLLSGVPYLASEDLLDYVTRISTTLGFDDDCVPLIYTKRLARTPIAEGATPPILMQFAFKLARDDFYNRYIRARNLSLTHLGFDVNKRIFINENLTEEARRIKTLAVKLKKAGKLASVYTRNGTVYIKANADADAVPIYAEDQLIE